ncbi:hypothetical protein COCC4DRAFT_80767 [Bipolaris maydis ATCC 48331]|uniref:Cytochrome P450 n=2 Tax=Cochliobolus heterostrophus TaxID=5016 RepID=M2UBM7_COCH5|nr:uncharacterized protein COCC4DRAFT_80767 [Bipolaris maydis ATCC 48331]EMD91116.1 hypothetical protein COCHEDRAFT_1194819 [Bipolaris maydis C5]KAH7560219.1 hypothetical protein BM1_03853 [Bipolaris maydis]ENI05803.1 hypothetical protein COCC4DRAFT_80767 [Bipolaris maydis ATCC 48331]KAJ5022823.1 cytochrome P450 [Bipolaris maydis]KAJ5064493.1 cytochrome P450 [Bipolaris maydis]
MVLEIHWQLLKDLPWLLSLIIGPIVATILFTYSVSYIYSFQRSGHEGSEPPLLPYWIPYFQHLPAFLLDPASLYERGREYFSGKPFTLLLAGTKFYVFYSPESVSYVFSRSRLFTFEPVMASMMENAVDLPPPDRPKFVSSTAEGKDGKFLTENHNIWTRNLSGKRLHDIMKIYMSVLPTVLESNIDLSNDKWQKKSLYPFLRKIIFETSVQTFFGPHLIQFWPNMWDDWRRFDDATYIGVRSNLAFKLQPKTHRARERMFQAFERWLDAAGNDEWEDTDNVWCEKWGLRMNWERDVLGRQSGFTKRGRACLQASFLFVIVTNAAPMATWFAYCAACNPSRLAEYRDAATPFLLSPSILSGSASTPHFDLPALIKNPFVQSLWLEALRLGTISAAARVITRETTLEGYLLRAGSVILMPVHLMHSGVEFPEAKKFQPDRWLDVDEEALKRQNMVMRPFGGGTSLCSGRFVAEMEIVGVVSVLLEMLDMKFEETLSENQWEFNSRSIGVMAPKKDVPVWIKRREKI